jgi:predicted metal-dependent hydrolase
VWKKFLNPFKPQRPVNHPVVNHPLSPTPLLLGSRQVPLLLVRHPRARRYLLRLSPDGTARVTIPRGGTATEARAFVERNTAWLENQFARLQSRPLQSTSWQIGREIWFRGELVRIEALAPDRIRFGGETLTVPAAHDQFTHDLRPAIEKHLRQLATRELPVKIMAFAAQHRFTVNRVTVRNQKSRWGSCSRRGTISLNWRLIQTPDWVRDYILLHELAHLRQMNHSAKFWREVENLCPDYQRAERWLKENRGIGLMMN